jgi:tyrosine-protein kinase Etk/Wzc
LAWALLPFKACAEIKLRMNTNSTSPTETPEEWEEGPALFSAMDALTWMGEGKKFIASATLLITLGSMAYALLKPNVFTARTSMLPPTSQQQSGSAAALAALGSLGALAGGSLSGKAPDELYVSLLKSDTVWRALSTQFDLKTRYDVKNYESLKSTIPRYVRVSSDKKSGLISVEVDDEDGRFAANLANAHSVEVVKLLSRLAVSEAQQRRLFFEQQLKDTKEHLIEAEQALLKVQEKSGMVVLDKQASAIIEAVAQLKTRIAEREIKLKVLRTTTTAENPDVRLLSSELSALRTELARMESSTPPSKSNKSEGSIDIPIGQLPAAAVEYVRAVREVKFQETMLASMLRQFEVAKLDEAKESPALQQVDVAMAPDRKSKPQRALIVLGGLLASLVLSSVFVIWRGHRKNTENTSPESELARAKLSLAWKLKR